MKKRVKSSTQIRANKRKAKGRRNTAASERERPRKPSGNAQAAALTEPPEGQNYSMIVRDRLFTRARAQTANLRVVAHQWGLGR